MSRPALLLFAYMFTSAIGLLHAAEPSGSIARANRVATAPGAANGAPRLRHDLRVPVAYRASVDLANTPAFLHPHTPGRYLQPRYITRLKEPVNWQTWTHRRADTPFWNSLTYHKMLDPTRYPALIDPATDLPMMNPMSYRIFANAGTWPGWQQLLRRDGCEADGCREPDQQK